VRGRRHVPHRGRGRGSEVLEERQRVLYQLEPGDLRPARARGVLQRERRDPGGLDRGRRRKRVDPERLRHDAQRRHRRDVCSAAPLVATKGTKVWATKGTKITKVVSSSSFVTFVPFVARVFVPSWRTFATRPARS